MIVERRARRNVLERAIRHDTGIEPARPEGHWILRASSRGFANPALERGRLERVALLKIPEFLSPRRGARGCRGRTACLL
jgi:hypothetical protein